MSEIDHSKKKPGARDTNPPELVLRWEVLRDIVLSIGMHRAETGGAFGGEDGGVEVSHYHFDESSRTSAVTYSPDHEFLNGLFKKHWNPEGIRLRGFVHSHPGRGGCPSHGDEVYARRILDAIDDLEVLWLPIVNTLPDTGEFRLTPWLTRRNAKGVDLVRGRIRIVEMPADGTRPETLGDAALESLRPDVLLDEVVLPGRPPTEARTAAVDLAKCGAGLDDATFDRVRDAYDLEVMRTGRIVAVGAGGAASWLEELARAGLGQFVLIDADVVSETNLATQQTYRRDIGRPKVECIAERILDINPSAKTLTIHKNLDVVLDEPAVLSDDVVEQLAFGAIDGSTPVRTVIAGLTDSFFAQARVNRIALELGLPSLCAQVYEQGRGAEVTFTYPGLTPACHRCILSSRYRHFLEACRQNDVTSHGTPIFSTTRLNAIKGAVALALFHHGSAHPRWGEMISRIGKRNLIQIRMDPDFAHTLGMKVFDRVFEKADHARLFFDEAIWLPQDQEGPATGYDVPCPDCGGTGDLRDAVGTIQDTRLARPASGDRNDPAAPRAAAMRRAAEPRRRSGGRS